MCGLLLVCAVQDDSPAFVPVNYSYSVDLLVTTLFKCGDHMSRV